MLQFRTRANRLAAVVACLLAFQPAAAVAQEPAPARAVGARPIGGVDPWLVLRGGEQSRVARANLELIDRALAPYRTTYHDLTPGDRSLVRQAFGDLLPAQRVTRHQLNPFQAQAIVYLALGHWVTVDGNCERRPDRRGPRDGRGGCTAVTDSLSREAAWIHSAALSPGRSAARRPRHEELAVLRGMAERARAILVTTPRCGCGAGMDDAEALFEATREAVDIHERSSMPAWMSLGSERVQRLARLSDTVERTLLRCLGDRT